MMVVCKKVELHLLLTANVSNELFDVFNVVVFECGVYVLGLIAMILLLFHVGSAVYFVGTQAVVAMVVYLMKMVIESPRPMFEMANSINNMDIIPVSCVENGFPSWHAAAMFACMFSLTFVLRNRTWLWSVLFFVLAVVMSYTQIYLYQNYLSDVLFGAIIGVSMSGLGAWVYTHKNHKWYDISLVNRGKKV